ncbi:MAG: Com family DNA-binding transcriptional regulator [Azoarcus sp.]|nr:Com family DNA-binding transcriptional regulator [Azoarcus sp.]
MLEIRCGSCNRKLAEAEYIRLAIKCPRCGTLNHYGHEPRHQNAQGRRENTDHGLPQNARQERV